ncbi:MAG TPA: hypothetical protein VN922_14715 [Bacteroidia bacterium]|nr:hypothetical protein [Bacteroidia bacterium]
MQSYSQIRAMLAITKSSLIGIFRSPSAVVFSFVFPFVFILVFGFIGNNGAMIKYQVAVKKGSDTSNVLYREIIHSPEIIIVQYSEDSIRSELRKGDLAGVIDIEKTSFPNGGPSYVLHLNTTTASGDKWPQLQAILNVAVNKVSDSIYPGRQKYAFVGKPYVAPVRAYKEIDFILPGQLGFSLLSSGVFGVAFMFFSLRNTLV